MSDEFRGDLREQALTFSLEYVLILMELEGHVQVFILVPVHPEDLVQLREEGTNLSTTNLPFYRTAGDSRAEYASSDEATTYIYVGLVVRLEMSVRLLRDDRQETTMALIVKGCCGDSRVSSEGDRKDRAAVRAEIEVLRRERLAYEQESMETRQALARSEAHCRALEARVIVLETEVHRHEWQRQAADDLAI
ncbi:hypothetical protein Tco_0534967 [Tanacetum coccineum]